LLQGSHCRAEAGWPVRPRHQANNQERGGGVGRQQLAAHQRMVHRPVMGRLQGIGIEQAVGAGDHRQDGANDPLPSNVQHRSNARHHGQHFQPADQPAEVRQGRLVEEAARTATNPDNAVAIGTAKASVDGVDDGKLFVDCRDGRVVLPGCLPNASQQRPQIVVNPQLAEAVA